MTNIIRTAIRSLQSDNPKPTIQNLKWAGLVVLVFALTFGGARAQAQQKTDLKKIGWLGARPGASDPARELLGREFRALGYVEGKNIIFEYRSADDNIDRLHALADELVGLKVDVLLASLTPAVVAAKNATRTIPIVFNGGFDPLALGLVDSLARPGGNITGFTAIAPALAGKRLELLIGNLDLSDQRP